MPKINFDEFENLNRVFFLFESKSVEGKESDLLELTGREDLWKERLHVFNNNGHDLSLLFGMGFTKIYYDYADNGLLTYFINFGLVGLLLKFFLYFLIYKLLVFFIKKSRINFGISISFILISLLLYEFSAETLDHIKLGPILLIFIQLGFQTQNNFKALNNSMHKNLNEGTN